MRYFACVVIALLAMSSAQAQAPSSETATAGTSFCERIAKPLKLEFNTGLFGATPKDPAYVHTQYSFKAFMVGDTFPTTLSASPVGEETLSEYKRTAAMCSVTRKGGRCELAGPVSFHIRTRYADVTEAMAPGENALIRVEGTTIICQNRSSAAVQN